MPKHTSVRGLYEAKVGAGELEPDEIQLRLADRLDALAAELADGRAPSGGNASAGS